MVGKERVRASGGWYLMTVKVRKRRKQAEDSSKDGEGEALRLG